MEWTPHHKGAPSGQPARPLAWLVLWVALHLSLFLRPRLDLAQPLGWPTSTLGVPGEPGAGLSSSRTLPLTVWQVPEPGGRDGTGEYVPTAKH